MIQFIAWALLIVYLILILKEHFRKKSKAEETLDALSKGMFNLKKELEKKD